MKKIDIKYVTYFNLSTQKYEVIHIADGTIMDGIDSELAAKAIAQLACLGNIVRGDDGNLYLSGDSYSNDIESLEEYMESYEETNGDDGPELEDENLTLCPPRDQLESNND